MRHASGGAEGSWYAGAMDLRSEVTAAVVLLPVGDLAATRDFYLRDLGLALEHDDGSELVARAGATLVGFVQSDGPGAVTRTLTLRLACRDVDALYRRLRRLGADADGAPRESADGLGRRFVVADPDGYRIELVGPAGGGSHEGRPQDYDPP